MSGVADALRDSRRVGEIEPGGDIFDLANVDHRGGCTDCPHGECPSDGDYYDDK